MADPFKRTPSRPLWEESSDVSINARRQFMHKYLPIFTVRFSFIQLSESIIVYCASFRFAPIFKVALFCFISTYIRITRVDTLTGYLLDSLAFPEEIGSQYKGTCFSRLYVCPGTIRNGSNI